MDAVLKHLEVASARRAVLRSQYASSARIPPRRLGTLIIDSKGAIRFCNDAVAQLAGMDGGTAMVGQKVRAFIPTLPFREETEGYNIAFATFAASRRHSCAWTMHARDGGTLQLEGRLAMRRTQPGFEFHLELERPVAKEKRSRHADAALPGIVRIAIDPQYRIAFACSSIEDLLGLDYEQVIGTPASSLIPELADRLGTRNSLKNARLALQKIGNFASHACHADGRRIPVTVSIQESSGDRLLQLLLHVWPA